MIILCYRWRPQMAHSNRAAKIKPLLVYSFRFLHSNHCMLLDTRDDMTVILARLAWDHKLRLTNSKIIITKPPTVDVSPYNTLPLIFKKKLDAILSTISGPVMEDLSHPWSPPLTVFSKKPTTTGISRFLRSNFMVRFLIIPQNRWPIPTQKRSFLCHRV